MFIYAHKCFCVCVDEYVNDHVYVCCVCVCVLCVCVCVLCVWTNCTFHPHDLGHRGPAYSLCNAGSLLVSGGTQELKAWKWEELVGNSEVQVHRAVF